MYFDVILDNDMTPIQNGTPEEVKEFLRSGEYPSGSFVIPGATMKPVSIGEYLGYESTNS